jgi:hypothetical protein
MCLQGSVLDSLNEFLEQQTSLIYYLGVTDITSSILSQLNDPTTSLVAVSGFPAIAQGNLVSAALLNKVYGIFKGDISLLKKYTPIGNNANSTYFSQASSSNPLYAIYNNNFVTVIGLTGYTATINDNGTIYYVNVNLLSPYISEGIFFG